jgi:hypothetical protein
LFTKGRNNKIIGGSEEGLKNETLWKNLGGEDHDVPF